MIWSVSTLLRRSGTPTPAWVMKASMSDLSWLEVLGRREGAAHGRRGRDQRGHEMGAAAHALAALEVAVGRRRAALSGRELVRVHAQAHRAACRAPLRAGVQEDLVQPL